MERAMLVTADIFRDVNPPWPNHTAYRLGQLRAQLDHFVAGGMISIAPAPYDKAKTAYLARIDPIEQEIWDIRSVDPKPGIRILGCFIETDVFVALALEYRANLDGPGGPRWEAFIQRAQVEWHKIFMTLVPFSGDCISDYVSSNFRIV